LSVKVLLAPTWELAEPVEADVTVEAEYGSHVKEGLKQTLAHHSGKYKGLPAVSTVRPPALGSGTILVSHLDLDTIIACLDLLGMGDKVSDSFREIAGHVDVKGPHRLNELDISKEDEEKIHAWWAREEALERKPQDKVSDVTQDIKKAGEILGKIMAHEEEHIEKGRSLKKKNSELEEESFKGVEGDVLIRISGRFVNHLYKHDNKVYKGIAALNTKFKSVTVSLEAPVPGLSCRDLVQKLWGKEAGGHDGIAGSPRGKAMTEKDLQEAAEAFNKALKGHSKEASYQGGDWVSAYLNS
jgi:hypothetical protein